MLPLLVTISSPIPVSPRTSWTRRTCGLSSLWSPTQLSETHYKTKTFYNPHHTHTRAHTLRHIYTPTHSRPCSFGFSGPLRDETHLFTLSIDDYTWSNRIYMTSPEASAPSPKLIPNLPTYLAHLLNALVRKAFPHANPVPIPHTRFPSLCRLPLPTSTPYLHPRAQLGLLPALSRPHAHHSSPPSKSRFPRPSKWVPPLSPPELVVSPSKLATVKAGISFTCLPNFDLHKEAIQYTRAPVSDEARTVGNAAPRFDVLLTRREAET